jgi:5-methylcytosine-specific restriction endonuclease McrA
MPTLRAARNGSTRQWRKVRVAVLQRDGNCCVYCGREATTVDHIQPVSRGGTDDEANLVAACGMCNVSKGPLTPTEWGRDY